MMHAGSDEYERKYANSERYSKPVRDPEKPSYSHLNGPASLFSIRGPGD